MITCVARDDLEDGGAGQMAATIRAIHARCPGTGVEVLISDYGGDEAALRRVLDAGPQVLNHNIETVPRLYSVELYFAELEGLRPGERVFDIAVQGETRVADLDVARRGDQPPGGPELVVERDVDGQVRAVAPHPDDDVVTAAGITYYRPDVTIAFLTNGDYNGDQTAGTARQGEAVAAQTLHLGRVEDDLIFFGYPDGYLNQVWDTSAPAVWGHPISGRSETYASRGLGSTDWHNYRTSQHADYNRQSMIDDMAALIDQRRPDHIFVTSHHDDNGDLSSSRYTHGVHNDSTDITAAANHYLCYKCWL